LTFFLVAIIMFVLICCSVLEHPTSVC
jgi:hypothetical protein